MEIGLDLTRLNRPLRALLEGLEDGTELAALIGEEYTQAIDERFKSEEDPDGSPWDALPPRYVDWKRRKRFITRINQMRGNMRARVTYQAFPDRVEIGSDTPYTRRQNARRPFLYRADGSLGPRDERRIEATTEAYLQDLADR